MDPLVSSTLISAGSSLLGGLIGGGEKRPRYKDAIQAGYYSTMKDFEARMDASKKYGLHPSLTLGVPTANSPAPFQAGTDDRVGAGIREMGQGISRAVEAGAYKEDRAVARESAALQLTNQRLQNERLMSEIALMNHARTPGLARDPSILHMPGQGDVVKVPKEVVANAGVTEKGISPADKTIRYTEHGKRVRVRSDAMADAGVEEGPAAWVYDFTRTVPDMIASEGQNLGHSIRREYDRTWWNPRNW